MYGDTFVKRFENGFKPGTTVPQWQAWLGGSTVYVPAEFSRMPQNAGEVWLCEEIEVLVDAPGFKQISVRLLTKLADPELKLMFEKNQRRITRQTDDLQHKCFSGEATIVYVADRGAKNQPTLENPWWRCRYNHVLHHSRDNDFFLIAVIPFEEDLEAKQRHEDALRDEAFRREQDRKDEEERQKQEQALRPVREAEHKDLMAKINREMEADHTARLVDHEHIRVQEAKPHVGGGVKKSWSSSHNVGGRRSSRKRF